jgi:hypothetical protein
MKEEIEKIWEEADFFQVDYSSVVHHDVEIFFYEKHIPRIRFENSNHEISRGVEKGVVYGLIGRASRRDGIFKVFTEEDLEKVAFNSLEDVIETAFQNAQMVHEESDPKRKDGSFFIFSYLEGYYTAKVSFNGGKVSVYVWSMTYKSKRTYENGTQLFIKPVGNKGL